jgi:hypothetical protein
MRLIAKTRFALVDDIHQHIVGNGSLDHAFSRMARDDNSTLESDAEHGGHFMPLLPNRLKVGAGGTAVWGQHH